MFNSTFYIYILFGINYKKITIIINTRLLKKFQRNFVVTINHDYTAEYHESLCKTKDIINICYNIIII